MPGVSDKEAMKGTKIFDLMQTYIDIHPPSLSPS